MKNRMTGNKETRRPCMLIGPRVVLFRTVGRPISLFLRPSMVLERIAL